MLVQVEILVEAVVVGNKLILPLVVDLLGEVHVLEARDVGLISWQGQWSHFNLAHFLVVVQDLGDVGMHL